MRFSIVAVDRPEPEVPAPSSTSSSPIFYEKPGLPEMVDDAKEVTVSPNGTRRVKFSNAPIRVGLLHRRNDQQWVIVDLRLGVPDLLTQ